MEVDPHNIYDWRQLHFNRYFDMEVDPNNIYDWRQFHFNRYFAMEVDPHNIMIDFNYILTGTLTWK